MSNDSTIYVEGLEKQHCQNMVDILKKYECGDIPPIGASLYENDGAIVVAFMLRVWSCDDEIQP